MAAPGAELAPGEHRLEGRLLAPCCWNQTLDTHDSPLAVELRHEIHDRLVRGESSVAIEDDMALRYGARIRAVPRDSDPRSSILIAVGVGMALTALVLGFRLRAWSRRSRVVKPEATPVATAAVQYNDRIDEALRDLDEA